DEKKPGDPRVVAVRAFDQLRERIPTARTPVLIWSRSIIDCRNCAWAGDHDRRPPIRGFRANLRVLTGAADLGDLRSSSARTRYLCPEAPDSVEVLLPRMKPRK